MHSYPRFVLRSLVLVLALTNAGCATILKGNTSSMRIEGLPTDAVVETADGIAVERTKPLTPRRPPTDTVLLSVSDPPRTVRVTSGGTVTQLPARRFVGAGWVVLGILTGLVPLVIDAASGNWYEYEDVSLTDGKRLAKP